MMRKIRELDFNAIIERVARATDKSRRKAYDDLMQNKLEFVNSPADAWSMLRDDLLIAAVRHAERLEDVRFEQPIVQALVRAQHHPLAKPIPEFEVQGGLSGPDASPHLTAIVDAHPELGWDLDAIQQLIIQAILEYGNDKLDDAQPPWLMYWNMASAAATALMSLVTLRTLGDLS